MYCGSIANTWQRRLSGGFSLIELLAVIAIIVTLLTLAGSMLWQGRSRSAPAGTTLASSIDLARSESVARNRTVWLRIAPDRKAPEHLELRFFRDDPQAAAGDGPVEFRRPVRLEQMMIQPALPDFGDRPEVDMPVTLTDGGTLLIRPGGEIRLLPETEGFPESPASLVGRLEIGLQANRGGRDHPVKGDVVALQIQGLSGVPVLYKP
jgi:prepilin-type N-terminal cleavage/methylation domain-containing protein